jgi:hypothetical protein
VILDVYSRHVVGWMLAERESADTVSRHDVQRGMLTLHADRGAAMRSKPVAALLVELDITKSHGRPHVSDDNPYSESQFKTMKHRPDFPARFGCIEDGSSALPGLLRLVQHRAPPLRHWLHDTPRRCTTATLKPCARPAKRPWMPPFMATPTRFKGRRPQAHALPTAAWINPPPSETITPKTNDYPCTVNS